MINHPDVEAVWICSPSQFHADQIKACAAAGKHIFCEKPIATDLPETIEAINACNAAGVRCNEEGREGVRIVRARLFR